MHAPRVIVHRLPEENLRRPRIEASVSILGQSQSQKPFLEVVVYRSSLLGVSFPHGLLRRPKFCISFADSPQTPLCRTPF